MKAAHSAAVKAGMELARQQGKRIGRPIVRHGVDVGFVLERRSRGESWRQIYLAYPPVHSETGRLLKPSIGSIRRAVGARGSFDGLAAVTISAGG